MPIQYVYKIQCKMYDEEGTERIVASEPIIFPNPASKGDFIYMSGSNLLVDKVAHNLNSGASWLEASHKAEDLEQEVNRLGSIFKEIHYKQLKEREK